MTTQKTTPIPATSSGKQATGPKGHPILGSMPDLQRDRLAFVTDAARYGPVVTYRLGPTRCYQMNHPDAVQHVLQANNANYNKQTRALEVVRRIGGNGLFTSENGFWLRQRRLMQPGFHRQRIAGFAGQMTAAALRLGDEWRAAAEADRAVDVAGDMMRLTLGVVVNALFSTDISADAVAIGQALTFLLKDITFRLDHLLYPPPGFPTPYNRRYRQAMAALDASVYRIIADRQKGLSSGEDLLEMLLTARDEDTGEGMDARQLRDEVVTIMVAGHETTANALAWAWHLLGEHPDVEARLHAELDAMLGDAIPTAADFPRLSFTRSVFEEALRLYPPVWLFDRMAVDDDEVLGYRIPAGSTVMLCPYVTQRLPEFWEAPDRFDPERFMPGHDEDRPRYAYFPFGGGPRQCIGNNFALMEGTLVLATLAGRFRLRPADGSRVEPYPMATLRPSELLMHPQPRP